jgi:dTDP-glucose 4,6-dehydratase
MPIRRAVITGGAGFLGSHLCERLLDEGADVTCVDNFVTGRPENIAHLLGRPGFVLVQYDVTNFLHVPGPVDAVLHFASPASPPDYLERPIQTLKVGSIGTWRALGLAKDKGARVLLASTSEVYGDPLVHPQPETYWGNVNPVGPRGVYDEAKRFAEAMCMAYSRVHGVPVRIARIFNTTGPRMRPDDGRLLPTLIGDALRGQPMTIHGDGTQTRSICYVSDLVEGLWLLLNSDLPDPVNLGNPEENSVLRVAELVAEAVGVKPEFRFVDRPVDDPQVRRPDISRAHRELGWKPEIPLRRAIAMTVDWFRDQLPREAESGPNDGEGFSHGRRG